MINAPNVSWVDIFREEVFNVLMDIHSGGLFTLYTLPFTRLESLKYGIHLVEPKDFIQAMIQRYVTSVNFFLKSTKSCLFECALKLIFTLEPSFFISK